MKKELLTLIACCALFASCSPNKSSKSEKEETLKVSTENVELTDSAFFAQTRILLLETTDASLVQSINAICMAGDTLFLLDNRQQKIFIFDGNGKFINAIHNIGNGPKEYVALSDISIQNGLLAVLCNRPYKIMYYSYDGQFVKERNVSDYFRNFATTDRYTYYYSTAPLGKRIFNVYDEQNGTEKQIPFPDGKYMGAEAQEEGTIYRVSAGRQVTEGHSVLFTWPFDYTIYKADNGEVKALYTIDFGERTLPKELLEQPMNVFEFTQLCAKEGYVHTIEDMVENEDYLIFKTNPWIFLIDKQERTVKPCSFIRVTEFMGGGSNDYLAVKGTDMLAQSYPPFLFKGLMRNVIAQNLLPHNELADQFARVYKELKDEDNPVLLLFQLPRK